MIGYIPMGESYPNHLRNLKGEIDSANFVNPPRKGSLNNE